MKSSEIFVPILISLFLIGCQKSYTFAITVPRCLFNFDIFIRTLIQGNKSGQAAAISSASGVNGLSSCSGVGAYSKGALNTIKL